MAGQIDIVVAKQAQKEVDLLIASLKTTYDEIIKINQTAVNFNGQTAPKNPTQVKKATEDLTAIEKQRLLVLKQLETTNARISVSENKIQQDRIKELKLQRDRERAIDSFNLKEQKAIDKRIAESNKLIAQKEKEFQKFEKEFRKYEANLAKQAIAEEQARKKTVQSIFNESKTRQSLEAQKEKEFQKYEANLAKISAAEEQAKRKKVQSILDENKARQSLANQKEKEIIKNKALSSAYLQLSQAEQASARRVQDLVARGREATQTQRQYTNELKKAQNEFNKYNSKVKQADAAVNRFNRNVGNYPTRIAGSIGNLMGAFGIVGGVSLFATIARDIFQTTKELQSLNNALKQVSGTQEDYMKNQAFISDISERFGLEIQGLTKQFTQFYVSAKDKISGQEIEQIFTSISKAGAVMGLSVDNQNRAFLAINQMMSKGTIQAEELRGQLGEALPGALGIMAKSLNVTEKELGKMMQSGSLLAADVLPKFAKQLEITYGIESVNRVETLAAAQNRLANSWTELVGSFNNAESGGISQFFQIVVNGLNGILALIVRANTAWGDLFGQSAKKGTAAGKTFFDKNIKLNSSDVELSESEKQALRKRFKDIKEEMKAGYNDPKLQEELNELSRKLNPSSGQAQALGTTAYEKIDFYTKKIEDLNKKIEEVESKKILNAAKRIFGMGSGANSFRADIEKANFDLAYWKQVKESADSYGKVIEKVVVPENKLTNAKKEQTKAAKEQDKAAKDVRFALIGTVEWFEKLRAALELEQKQVSQTSDKWQEYKVKIDTVQASIDKIINSKEELEGIELDLSDDKNMTDSEGDRLKEEGDRLREVLRDFKQSFVDEFADQSGFGKTLDLLSGGLDKFEGDAVSTALAVSEAFQEAFNTIASFSNANFEQMYTNLEQQRDVSILFAGESATAKEEIERQYEERRKKIQRQQAESQKRMAMFNIAMNTAQGIVAALAMLPPNIPLSIAIGSIGAVQLGLVASQQIPAFAEGGTHEGGLMLVNDAKGNGYKEKIVTPDGKVISPKGRNVVMNAPKGTQIFTENQWEKQLNNILLNNGINQTQNASNSNSTIVNVESKDNYNFSIDENGISKFITRGTTRTNILNSRFKIQGKDV